MIIFKEKHCSVIEYLTVDSADKAVQAYKKKGKENIDDKDDSSGSDDDS